MEQAAQGQSSEKNLEPWQIWADHPESEGTLADRARSKLPEMESTKQLVKLVEEVYQPGMRVLDVGCNVGHYLIGLRRLDPTLKYKGVDAYPVYINKAREIFESDPNSDFEVKDIFQPLFPSDAYDIVYCCNVILHLPEFKTPVKNLLDSTRQVCFIRSLFDNFTTRVQRASGEDFDDNGMPSNFAFQNTWDKSLFTQYVESLGWKVEFIADEFDASILEVEFETLKKGDGTRVLGGKQIDGNIVFNWSWAKCTRM